MTTLVDYRRLVRLKGYDTFTDAQIDDTVNEARRRLVRDRRWTFLSSTSSSLVTIAQNPAVALSGIADLQHLDAVRITVAGSERDMSFMPLEELRSEQDVRPSIDVPRFWTRRNGTLLLYPTPDIVYTLSVEYVAKPAQLTTGTDPLIPDEMQDLVAWAAVPPLAFRQRDGAAMTYAENHYKEQLRMAIGQESMQQRQRSQQVGSGYWGSRER